MPVESSQDAPVVQYRLHPSHHHPVAPPHHHHFLPCCAEDLDLGAGPDDLDLCISSSAAAAYSAHHQGDGSDNGSNTVSSQHLISTHSPPLINLSPNLSPSSESCVSPFYDFRETTRRRSFHEQHNSGHPMQHSPQVISGYIAADDSGRKVCAHTPSYIT
ncbi:E3 ubiquitin-protein ligase rnf38-like isoform x3 [Plakobranchus ocellatus]|uniref:E3 ubiquitin-protein ligase rnf38-like isoform x3 n=1 Tax=Plakobranchus ocellatus TaxID=259542 RepID=A0AAV3YYH5_9GAST|nr:E3 ubiquitin-protein ligase rnf38-like isoform x3 [Plakobranchus ocellatus]